jgi:hypothetical protein
VFLVIQRNKTDTQSHEETVAEVVNEAFDQNAPNEEIWINKGGEKEHDGKAGISQSN